MSSIFLKIWVNVGKRISKKKIAPKSLSIYSRHVVNESGSAATSSSSYEGLELQRQKTESLGTDQKRKQLEHKEDEKSFWRSWFSFGSSFSDSDTDSDDEKSRKSNKLINENSRPSKGREHVTMSTRKSSACAYHNFNAPHPSEEKKQKVRSSTDRTLR